MEMIVIGTGMFYSGSRDLVFMEGGKNGGFWNGWNLCWKRPEAGASARKRLMRPWYPLWKIPWPAFWRTAD